MNEVHIIAWAGEPTYIALEQRTETYTPEWASFIYREHVKDSLTDFEVDRSGEYSNKYYAPIPMTYIWTRR